MNLEDDERAQRFFNSLLLFIINILVFSRFNVLVTTNDQTVKFND
jgi:hypothetical protein